jgi:enediyne biosynthesis protein E4
VSSLNRLPIWMLVAGALIATSCRRSTDLAPASAAAQTPATGGIGRPVAVPSVPTSGSGRGPRAADPPVVPPRFVNVTAASGIDFTYFNDAVPGRYFLPEVMGGGAAWLDFDGDGWLDLFLPNGCRLKDPDPRQTEHRSRLYRNRGDGTFADVTSASSCWHNGFGQGCAVGDYDADGFPDLFLANYGPDVLFHNNGDGTFTRVTQQAGTTDELWSTSAAWFDADGDGWLDLYVVTYVNTTFANHRVCEYGGITGYCGPGQYEAVPDRLYVSRGDGTFVDRLDEYGMSAAEGKGLSIVVVDLDNDLRPEVYVGNDMTANFLFTRRDSPAAPISTDGPSRRWAEIAMTAGCAVSGTGLNEASMGIACADFDGDGLPDLYLTQYYNAKNTLYRNLGRLSFVDESYRSRAAAISKSFLGFGTIPIDYDRDGAPDLFVATGHVLGHNVPPCEMTPQLLHNDGQGRLTDISRFAGDYFQERSLGRGVAAADFDNDGDLDLVISHIHRPVVLLRNDTETGRHFVGFELRTLNRVPPVGGRVVVSAGQYRRTLPVQTAGSYLSASDGRLLFGLGDVSEPVTAEIFWPSGRVDRLPDLEVDNYWVVYEGAPPLRSYLTGGR